jgi:hypothetical protein
LDRDATRPNAAKRGLAKRCLNSLWGKLAERQNRTQTNLISDPHELYSFLATPGVEVMNLMFASDSFVRSSFRYTEEEQVPSLRHSNDVVAAYVACGSRMHLYAHLDKNRERAVYCYTVLYLCRTPTNGP